MHKFVTTLIITHLTTRVSIENYILQFISVEYNAGIYSQA